MKRLGLGHVVMCRTYAVWYDHVVSRVTSQIHTMGRFIAKPQPHAALIKAFFTRRWHPPERTRELFKPSSQTRKTNRNSRRSPVTLEGDYYYRTGLSCRMAATTTEQDYYYRTVKRMIHRISRIATVVVVARI